MPAWDETGFGVPGPKPYELHWAEEKIIDLQAEIERLRAENAELQTFIKGVADAEEISGRSMRLFIVAARALLAIRAEDPNDAQEC